MRVLPIVAAALLTLAALARFGATATAQTPAPTPQTVAIPGSARLEPGTSVTFRRPSDNATLIVSYHGREPAMVTYDGTVLTVSVPPLTSNLFLSVRGGARCVPVEERWNLRCDAQPAVGGARVFVSVLNAHPPVSLVAPPPGFTLVPLAAGCTNVGLSFPDGTPVDVVHDAVHGAHIPTHIVEAVWKYDPATRRFLGWSPQSGAPNDFEQVNRLDAVFICMDAAGQLVQPATP